MESKCIRLCPEAVRLPKRERNSYKSSYGKLLILGGAVGYTGAVSLCARSAVRSGAGLVRVGVPAEIYPIVAVKLDEPMPFPIERPLAYDAVAEKLQDTVADLIPLQLQEKYFDLPSQKPGNRPLWG